jgi:sulfate transport system ATP-binding protein
MSIHIKDVSKKFGAFKALDEVELHIETGELVALLGPSGSGKTTLLRCIAGLENPDSGTIHHFGEDLSNRSPRERNIGFVFQHYALFNHMTVFENIAFGLRVRKEKPAVIKARVTEMLKLIQLESLEKRFPSQLSGGQRQRVALARALAPRPRAVLLDEPFGALDARVRADLRRWIRKLHEETKQTGVFVTHDQEEAFDVADRVVVMNKGRIEQIGTPEEVFAHPASEFVVDFLGGVNVWHGRIEDGHAKIGDLHIPVPDGHEKVDNAETARVYVRRHDIEITRTLSDNSQEARVTHINRSGAAVKVSLVARGEKIDVELDHRRFEELALKPGDHVYLETRRARVFA